MAERRRPPNQMHRQQQEAVSRCAWIMREQAALGSCVVRACQQTTNNFQVTNSGFELALFRRQSLQLLERQATQDVTGLD